MAPKSVGLNDSPWENHSSSRERRRFCVSRAWRCSSQRTAIFILFVLLLLPLGVFLPLVIYFRGFRSKIREDLFLSLTMIQRVGYIFFRALLLLILFRLRRRRAVEREMMLRGARVFINVAQQ